MVKGKILKKMDTNSHLQKLKFLLNLTETEVKRLRKLFPSLTPYEVHTEGIKAFDWAIEHYVTDVEGFFTRWLDRAEETKIRRNS